jgi:hypothetical protein
VSQLQQSRMFPLAAVIRSPRPRAACHGHAPKRRAMVIGQLQVPLGYLQQNCPLNRVMDLLCRKNAVCGVPSKSFGGIHDAKRTSPFPGTNHFSYFSLVLFGPFGQLHPGRPHLVEHGLCPIVNCPLCEPGAFRCQFPVPISLHLSSSPPTQYTPERIQRPYSDLVPENLNKISSLSEPESPPGRPMREFGIGPRLHLLQRGDKAAIRGQAGSPRLRLFGTSYPHPKFKLRRYPTRHSLTAAAGPVVVSMNPIGAEEFPASIKIPCSFGKIPCSGQKIPCSDRLRELGCKSLKPLHKLTPIRPDLPGIGKIPC